MQITLNLDDDVAAISFTILTFNGMETGIRTTCLDVRGADGKVIDFPNDGKVAIREVQDDDKR